MKKLISAMMAVSMMIALSACSGNVPANYVHNVADMDGKTVGVLAVSDSAGYMDRFAGRVNVRQYETVKSLTAALEGGEVDCVLADAGTYRRMTGQSRSVTRLEEPYADCDYRLAVSIENKEMLRRLEAALKAAEDRGALDWARENYKDPEKTVHVPDPEREKVTVVPEPAKESRTIASGSLAILTIRSTSCTGFGKSNEPLAFDSISRTSLVAFLFPSKSLHKFVTAFFLSSK